ncbi:MAG TPA: hypothetical protein VNQ90_05245 [Chthoniobacteraceae bacterium]|nr:hypothetical protein [Chthoniobacteraceae bacterium]
MHFTDSSLPSSLQSLFSRSNCYAGIGSRAAPAAVLTLMEHTAAHLAGRGLTLRSGGAPGADAAFERGCDRAHGKKEIFLPWKEFNGHPSPYFCPPRQAEVLASFMHPNWASCTPAARKLHARNCQQVCGLRLDDPVGFVLFWAPEEGGKVKGGTATAVSLARELDIPTYNLWNQTLR